MKDERDKSEGKGRGRGRDHDRSGRDYRSGRQGKSVDGGKCNRFTVFYSYLFHSYHLTYHRGFSMWCLEVCMIGNQGVLH